MKAIENKNKVDIKTIEKYDEINGHDVIRETLLFKGCEICFEKASVRYLQKKYLEETALYLYGLKVNATNKLYVSYVLDIYWRRNNLLPIIDKGGYVVVPEDIYNECKKINDSYKQ
jgi:hypothetical protein